MTCLYRKATMADVPAIHELINAYALQGLMLRRPMLYLYESVRDYVVAVEPDTGDVVGVGGLHIMWRDLAEIRSLAVKPGLTGKGVGKGIVAFLLEEAQALGLSRVFALTYQQAFFARCGFTVIPKETLPQKVWKECVYCDRFHACDEIAMIRHLGPPAEASATDWVGIPLYPVPNWQKES
jgi:amino-acid N-acetyltransferase